MDKAKQRRTTWIVIAAALAIVVSGIVYLSLSYDPNAITPVNDGYDDFRVSLADAKAAFDNEEALFVDVRSAGEFEQSHIPGAVLIPLSNIAGNEPEVDKDALIYTYCTWPTENLSARAAEYLQAQGYSNVFAIVGGYRAWIDAGYPIVTGE